MGLGSLFLCILSFIIIYYHGYFQIILMKSKLHLIIFSLFISCFLAVNFLLPRTRGLRSDGSNWKSTSAFPVYTLTTLLLLYAITCFWEWFHIYSLIFAMTLTVVTLVFVCNMLAFLP